jgi:hypothetical protein
VAPLITDDNFGAWLLKCNPKEKWNLPQFIADGGEFIDNWSVVKNYRSAMMAPGDLIVFWVSGDSRLMTRGIWGTGWVTEPVHDELPESLQPGDIDYWTSEAARLAVTNSVGVDIPLFETAVSDADLKAAGIIDLEVQLQHNGSNPSWISKDQLAALQRLLPDWPDPIDSGQGITVNAGGAGFGDPVQNQIVELAAMDAVTNYYELGGWDVDDVSASKVGWDLTCIHPTGELAHVEVKGVSGDHPIVLLTANELRAAESTEGWVLAVVTRALSGPAVTEFAAHQAVAAAKPYVFKADLTDWVEQISPEGLG